MEQSILKYLVRPYESYLNVGSGGVTTAKYLIQRGKTVTDLDIYHKQIYQHPNYTFFKADFMRTSFDLMWDVVLASHVMEHVQDTSRFLNLCRRYVLSEFIVIVPPMKPNIVGGHVHVFNMGLLMYNLALAGFNVVDGHFLKTGYNIIGIVKPSTFSHFPRLKHDVGDIKTLVKYDRLPDFFRQDMNGDMESYNWDEKD